MTRLILAFLNFAIEPTNRWRFEAIISKCKANVAPLNCIRIGSVVSPSAKYRIIRSENPHHLSFGTFRVTAGSALFVAIPAGREPGSTCFSFSILHLTFNVTFLVSILKERAGNIFLLLASNNLVVQSTSKFYRLSEPTGSYGCNCQIK